MTASSGIAQHDYQLLGRLQQDCNYYLGHGQRAAKHLWAQNEAEQIKAMRELYAALPEKPEWISSEDIDRYEAEMVHNGAASA